MIITLEKADNQEFGQWWAAYRTVNEDFSEHFTDRYQDFLDLPYCHWIMQDDTRIGGAISVGNNLGDLFLIPPFEDIDAVLTALIPQIGAFNARNIIAAHVPAFQRIGFDIKEARCWMIRPTQAYSDIEFAYKRTEPTQEDASALADLMFAAFQGGVGRYGLRTVTDHRKSIDNYLETIATDLVSQRAASLLWDGDHLVAACLVQPHHTHGTIRFVITHPEYQRQGLAKQMIHHAIDGYRDTYAYMTLAVTVGNPSQALYHQMGFVAAPVVYELLSRHG